MMAHKRLRLRFPLQLKLTRYTTSNSNSNNNSDEALQIPAEHEKSDVKNRERLEPKRDMQNTTRISIQMHESAAGAAALLLLF